MVDIRSSVKHLRPGKSTRVNPCAVFLLPGKPVNAGKYAIRIPNLLLFLYGGGDRGTVVTATRLEYGPIKKKFISVTIFG